MRAAERAGVEWANGSRVVCLPDQPDSAVGFPPQAIVADEATRVPDKLYLSVRPVLALGASLGVLNTPFGKRGWFFRKIDTPARLAGTELRGEQRINAGAAAEGTL